MDVSKLVVNRDVFLTQDPRFIQRRPSYIGERIKGWNQAWISGNIKLKLQTSPSIINMPHEVRSQTLVHAI